MSNPKAIQIVTDNGETYSFVWTDEFKVEMLRQFGRMAADPTVSFEWIDAARAAIKFKEVYRNESRCKASLGRQVK